MAFGLTLEQQQEVKRNKTTSQYLKTNDTLVATYIPLDDLWTLLKSQLGILDDTIPGKNISSKDLTTEKGTLKHKVARAYEFICAGSYLFCQTADMKPLGLGINFHFSESKIYKLDDEDIYSFAEGINKLVTDNLLPKPAFSAYNIDAGVLTAALEKADTFRKFIGKADAVIDTTGAVGKEIEEQIVGMRDTIDSIALAGVRFKESDSDFYEGLQSALLIDDSGVHHQYVEGEVKDADGIAVKGVVITVIEENGDKPKVTKTNFMGHYKTPYLKLGNIILRCEVAGKPTQEKVMRVKRGTILHIDFTM